jgi:hypothetical protein
MSDAARGTSKRVELTGLRRGTVRSMSISAVVPQFTLQRDVPTGGLRELRRTLKSAAHTATLTDVITMACARALREHPGVNASYGDDCVMLHERINIGLALALDDGLTVPVILDADARSLEGLASERLRLAEAARDRSLRPEEIFAGTFSISNLGPLGVDRCARRSASRGRSTTARSTARRRRASWPPSPVCWPSPDGRSRRQADRSAEARAQRRCHARQIQCGARALALAVGSAQAGLAGGHVIGAPGLVVQLTRVTQM